MSSVPEGTTDNSPPFQRWVSGDEEPKPREGRQIDCDARWSDASLSIIEICRPPRDSRS